MPLILEKLKKTALIRSWSRLNVSFYAWELWVFIANQQIQPAIWGHKWFTHGFVCCPYIDWRLPGCPTPLTWIWGHHRAHDQEHELLLHSPKRLSAVWSVFIPGWHTGRLTLVTLSTGASWELVGDERSMQMSPFSQSPSRLQLWGCSNNFPQELVCLITDGLRILCGSPHP